jgi:hypothetical protein
VDVLLGPVTACFFSRGFLTFVAFSGTPSMPFSSALRARIAAWFLATSSSRSAGEIYQTERSYSERSSGSSSGEGSEVADNAGGDVGGEEEGAGGEEEEDGAGGEEEHVAAGVDVVAQSVVVLLVEATPEPGGAEEPAGLLVPDEALVEVTAARAFPLPFALAPVPFPFGFFATAV